MLFEKLIEILDPGPHGAALNMAIDEALLRTAHEPLLRIYRWTRPAVSFGYFGKWAEVRRAWPDRDLVRRWTGGGIVPHGEDLTYSLVVPRTHPFFALNALESYRVIHACIADAIGGAALALSGATKISEGCFENAAQHDVLFGGRKVAGAAQRRTKSGLLHQGSIQSMSGLAKIADVLPKAFGLCIRRAPLSREVMALAADLIRDKYGADPWTGRF